MSLNRSFGHAQWLSETSVTMKHCVMAYDARIIQRMATLSLEMVEGAVSQYPSPWTGKRSAKVEHHAPDVYKMLLNFHASGHRE
eukprot:6487488-Amphidinium_carterae.2